MTIDLLAAVPCLTDLLTGWRLVTSIAGILVVAWLAGRLLGARQAPGAVVVSGLIGWSVPSPGSRSPGSSTR